jgi:hypothetical protein
VRNDGCRHRNRAVLRAPRTARRTGAASIGLRVPVHRVGVGGRLPRAACPGGDEPRHAGRHVGQRRRSDAGITSETTHPVRMPGDGFQPADDEGDVRGGRTDGGHGLRHAGGSVDVSIFGGT